MDIKKIPQARRIYRDLAENPEFRDIIREYESKIGGVWKFRRVLPREGSYMCSFHTHTDHYPLERVAEVAALRGFNLVAVTNHNEDHQFEGKRVIYYPQFGTGITLVRGMEACCEDFTLDLRGNKVGKPDRRKILLVGYDGSIQTKQTLAKTIEDCKRQEGLILVTSAFNDGSRGLNEEQLEKHFPDIDAIGVLDSGYNLYAGISWTKLYAFDMQAKYFAMGNNDRRRQKAMFHEANSHVLAEIGVAADYIKKEDLRCLESPEEVERHPELLIDGLRDVFARCAIEGDGFYIPGFSICRGERLKIAIGDMIESRARYLKHGY